MNKKNEKDENRIPRSDFIRGIVQRENSKTVSSLKSNQTIPKRIIQFWHNLEKLPDDVNECIQTWKELEKQGIIQLLFDKQQAGNFINKNLGSKYKRAYDKCYHPAMQSDYFRLCYIFIEGGCYIDVDDIYLGSDVQFLFEDDLLKIQPLCYDILSGTMISPKIFTNPEIKDENWIFYFNNNPLIANSGHPLIELALIQATLSLEKDFTMGLPEIQSTTGPGNLSKSIFDAMRENSELEKTLLVLSNWEYIVASKWELGYRNDSRNWRLSNCQTFQEK